jgi:hypothetical protein
MTELKKRILGCHSGGSPLGRTTEESQGGGSKTRIPHRHPSPIKTKAAEIISGFLLVALEYRLSIHLWFLTGTGLEKPGNLYSPSPHPLIQFRGYHYMISSLTLVWALAALTLSRVRIAWAI